ncbi:MAG: hypothetical protein CEE43_00340 [Promethearchaeota archaeon Loki_b32]|nr:MAG: hypothetical protein CEE43_00340 [Candidatus Lokiarchaeota archaeon Loki_b32]
MLINGSGSSTCISIEASSAYFIIRNCTLLKASSAGLKISATRNGLIRNNIISNNYGNGIRIDGNSNNNTVVENDLCYNFRGVYFYGAAHHNLIDNNNISYNGHGVLNSWCNDNNITRNILINNGNGTHYEENGIYIVGQNNVVLNNTIINNREHGVHVYGSNNKILKNKIYNSRSNGIFLTLAHQNIVKGNKIYNSSENGIDFDEANFNIIFQNILKNNTDHGVYIIQGAYNLFYNNTFLKNQINARSYGSGFNDWNNSYIGNFWDDYQGKDENDDGVGEEPYYLYGKYGDNYDFLPIWWDAPVISITYPNVNETYENSPYFEISIDEGIADSKWYSIDDGIKNITFTGLAGVINQTEWSNAPEGPIEIIFYANDSRGYIGKSEVVVVKNLTAPEIIINSPSLNQIYGFIAPTFNITIHDLSPINRTWYTIDGGDTNYTFYGTLEQINQTAWTELNDGQVTIQFYANDSLGYLGFTNIKIEKDTTAPIIIITSPNNNDVFETKAPTFQISIDELNLESMWYSLDGGITNITFSELNGVINQSIWYNIHGGDILITFYAQDRPGNIGIESVLVKKRYPPQQQISGYNLFMIIGAILGISIIILKLKKQK